MPTYPGRPYCHILGRKRVRALVLPRRLRDVFNNERISNLNEKRILEFKLTNVCSAQEQNLPANGHSVGEAEITRDHRASRPSVHALGISFTTKASMKQEMYYMQSEIRKECTKTAVSVAVEHFLPQPLIPFSELQTKTEFEIKNSSCSVHSLSNR